MMLALSSDYKPLSRDVRHFFTKVSGGIVKAKQRYNCCARLTTSMCIKWSRCRLPELHVACGIARLVLACLCGLAAVCSLSSLSHCLRLECGVHIY